MLVVFSFYGIIIVVMLMKKIFQISLLLFALFVVLEIIFVFLKTNHKIEYKIKTDNYIFNIKEQYRANKYFVDINVEDDHFSIMVPNEFNKKKNIIENIKYFISDDDYVCIYPILFNNKDFNIICKKNDMMYSYYAIKNMGFVKDFINQLKNDGYDNKTWTEINYNTINSGELKLYIDALTNDAHLYVWNYKGFYNINNNNIIESKLFVRDIYSNKLAIKVNKYYVIPNYEKVYEFDTLRVYDMASGVFKKIDLGSNVSYNSYYNGIIDNCLYLFDRDNLIQYEIDVAKKKVEIVGNTEINGKYYNNGWSVRNIYDFKNDTLLFNEKIVPQGLNEIALDNIYIDDGIYYYLDDNQFYMYNEVSNDKTLLFGLDDPYNIKIVKNNIYLISGDTLYQYNYFWGLKKIVEYKEFLFNRINMYEIYE